MRVFAVAVLVLSFFSTLSQARTASGPVVLLGASVVEFWASERPAFFAAHPDWQDHGRAGEPFGSTGARASVEVPPLKPRVMVMITGGAGSPERTVHDLDRFVALAKKAGARVAVAGSPSIKPENLAAIRDYAAREHLAYADFADMRDADGRVKPGMTYDGIHPTSAGYDLMEPVTVAAVDRALAGP